MDHAFSYMDIEEILSKLLDAVRTAPDPGKTMVQIPNDQQTSEKTYANDKAFTQVYTLEQLQQMNLAEIRAIAVQRGYSPCNSRCRLINLILGINAAHRQKREKDPLYDKISEFDNCCLLSVLHKSGISTANIHRAIVNLVIRSISENKISYPFNESKEDCKSPCKDGETGYVRDFGYIRDFGFITGCKEYVRRDFRDVGCRKVINLDEKDE
jgi:hypothetical protein